MEAFSDALDWVYRLPERERKAMADSARACGERYSLDNTTEKLVGLYRTAIEGVKPVAESDSPLGLETLMARLTTEWEILKAISQAGDEALSGSAPESL